MATTARGYPYPVEGEPPNGPTQIGALAAAVDATPGIAVLTYAAINALSGAALWNGRRVYQTNTGVDRPTEGDYVYNVNWRRPWNMPWGALSLTTLTSDATAYAGFVTVPTLAATVTIVGNRSTKITFTAPWHNGTASNGAQARILDGATQLHLIEDAPNAGTNGHIHLVWSGSLSVGSHTITPQVGHDVAGSVNLLVSSTRPAQLLIEDVGSNGAPT